jgi:catechol 2,3-dioxygenase-like lactoylglutathione lyase family enzyme
MNIGSYSWAGAPTDDFDETMRFFEEVLGFHVVVRDDETDFGMFRMPSGQVFEVFGPKSDEHGYLKMPAVGFDVEDVRQAREELEAQGIEFVTDILTIPSGKVSWTYFVGPDGFLYEIWQRDT